MRKPITIGDLKKFIENENLTDDTPILCPAPDHSYEGALIRSTTALLSHGDWAEDYGEEMTPEAEFGKRVKAIVIGR